MLWLCHDYIMIMSHGLCIAVAHVLYTFSIICQLIFAVLFRPLAEHNISHPVAGLIRWSLVSFMSSTFKYESKICAWSTFSMRIAFFIFGSVSYYIFLQVEFVKKQLVVIFQATLCATIITFRCILCFIWCGEFIGELFDSVLIAYNLYEYNYISLNRLQKAQFL